ncbi:MAG TPA: hypothetical protein VHG92_10230 [Afifellaceae bacterium]|nr:hypothetical protein [Afifellaceae bacterium]
MRRRGAAGGGRGATLLLTLVVAALAYANWRVVELELDISPAAAGVGGAVNPFSPPQLEPPPEPPPLSDFDEVVRRPLFTAGRRPPNATEESAPEGEIEVALEAAEPPPPELRLVGIAIDGGIRQALLRIEGEGEEWVREGDDFAGWRLGSVKSDSVVLRSGERSHALSLYPARDPAGQ